MSKTKEYAAFVDAVKAGLIVMLTEMFHDDFCLEEQKENAIGGEGDYLVIKREGSHDIGFNLTHLYEKKGHVELGEAVINILEGMQETLHQYKSGGLDERIDEWSEYESIKSQLQIRLISKENFQKAYQMSVYQCVGDMIQIVCINAGDCFVIINHSQLELYGIDEKTIMEDAFTASMKNHPATFTNMSDIVYGYIDDPKDDDSLSEMLHHMFAERSPLWVVSNEERRFGAAVILYPGQLERIAEELDDSYYILPSSVHELIVIRKRDLAEDVREEKLLQMVQEINRTEVDECDRLSDSLYFYQRESKTLTKYAGAVDAQNNQSEVGD